MLLIRIAILIVCFMISKLYVIEGRGLSGIECHESFARRTCISSIQEAVDAACDGTPQRFVIYFKSYVYKETDNSWW